MTFSIITPSYNQSAWLRLCVASIADQKGVELEHIVQDACSKDGTQDWIRPDSRVKAFIEKDQGMYDAVNRGFARGGNDILAYLNCDEQYLPGALKRVEEFFATHPEVDAVVSDTIVTDNDGDYICHRYSLVPREPQMWVRFPVLTCSLFLRKRVVQEMGVQFNLRWTNIGDFFWVHDMVKKGVRFGVLKSLTSVFTDTGENLNLKESGVRERREKWEMMSPLLRAMKYPYIAKYRLELALRGPNFRQPFDYEIYTLASPNRRTVKKAEKPTSYWRRRLEGLPPEV